MNSDAVFATRKACSHVLSKMSDDELIDLAKEHVYDYEEQYDAYCVLMDIDVIELADILNVDWQAIEKVEDCRNLETREMHEFAENEFCKNAI